MEDFEKIQRREAERQKVFKDLKSLLLSAEEKAVDQTSDADSESVRGHFHFAVSMNLSMQLLQGIAVSGLVSEKIMSMIRDFTKVETEQSFLVACLLEFSIAQITCPFNQKMTELSVPPGRDWFLKEIGFDALEE